MVEKLNKHDVKLLELLQKDATLSTAALGERVGLSQAACWRRLQVLREQGFITDTVALVDEVKLGWELKVFVQLKLRDHGRERREAVVNALIDHPQIVQCHIVLGGTDAILMVVAKDMDDYKRLFFNYISQIEGVAEMNSLVVFDTLKETTVRPV